MKQDTRYVVAIDMYVYAPNDYMAKKRADDIRKMIDDYDLTNLKTDKKKRTNSKAKGSRFERKIASILNDRLNTKEFSRTPGSGAFATTHNLPDYLKIYGDLIAPSKFKYCIECKKGYKNIKINHILLIIRNIVIQSYI